MAIAAPSYCLEQSICNYLQSQNTVSGSLLSGSNLNYYTAINNSDKSLLPGVVVDASEVREVVPFSRNYEFNTKIEVYEIAADVTALGTLAEAVFNECVNSATASLNFSNKAYNINVWQVQTLDMATETSGDALINKINLRIIGALVPST